MMSSIYNVPNENLQHNLLHTHFTHSPDFDAAITDNSSVNTYQVEGGKDLVTMTEVTSGTFKVNMDLEILDLVEYKDEISGLMTTAHPVVYPDGKIYNLFTDVSFISQTSYPGLPLSDLYCKDSELSVLEYLLKMVYYLSRCERFFHKRKAVKMSTKKLLTEIDQKLEYAFLRH